MGAARNKAPREIEHLAKILAMVGMTLSLLILILIAVSRPEGRIYIIIIIASLLMLISLIVIKRTRTAKDKLILPSEDKLIVPSGGVGVWGWIEEQLRRLPVGHMAVNVANEMRVHRRERLTVAIGRAEREEVIAAVGEARGNILVDQIKVGATMRVEVSGDAFQIENPERLNKIVIEEEATVWDYSVIPLKRGTQTLTIRGIVRIHLRSGDQEYYELPILERHIRVRINASHTTKQCLRVAANRFVAATIFIWGIAAALIVYVLKLDSVKETISNLVKPFVAFH
jgi:hypothetical protein